MSYSYMSNIKKFTQINSPDESYQTVGKYDGQTDINTATPLQGVITFTHNNINQKANFLMIRAHDSNSLLLQLYPYDYGVYIPAGELWSVDSLDKIEKIIVKNIFILDNENYITTNTGKIQWMIGYK